MDATTIRLWRVTVETGKGRKRDVWKYVVMAESAEAAKALVIAAEHDPETMAGSPFEFRSAKVEEVGSAYVTVR